MNEWKTFKDLLYTVGVTGIKTVKHRGVRYDFYDMQVRIDGYLHQFSAIPRDTIERIVELGKEEKEFSLIAGKLQLFIKK